MNKKLIYHNIKDLLPYAITTLFTCLLIAIIYSSTVSIGEYEAIHTVDGQDIYEYYTRTISTEAITIPSLIFAMLLPLYINNYRYKLSLVDTYLQLPLKKNQYRNYRSVIGLIYMMTSFTIVFWIGVLGIYFNQLVYSQKHIVTGTYFYNYTPFLYNYLLSFLIIAVAYFLSLAISSLYDNMLDGVIALIACNVAIIMFYNVILSYIDELSENNILYSSYFYFCSPFSFLSLFSGLNEYLIRQNHNIYPYGWGTLYITTLSISCILMAALFALSIYYVYFRKEPSGEYCNSVGGRTKYGTLTIHILALSLAPRFTSLYGSRYYFDYLSLILYVIYLVSYYLIIALFNRTVKIKLFDIYIILGIFAISLISPSIYNIRNF